MLPRQIDHISAGALSLFSKVRIWGWVTNDNCDFFKVSRLRTWTSAAESLRHLKIPTWQRRNITQETKSFYSITKSLLQNLNLWRGCLFSCLKCCSQSSLIQVGSVRLVRNTQVNNNKPLHDLVVRRVPLHTHEEEKKETLSRIRSLNGPIAVATGSLHQSKRTDGVCATGNICSNEQRPLLQMEGGKEAGSET